MQELNEAWAVLRSPSSRAKYDDELAKQHAEAPAEVRRRTSLFVDDDMPAPRSMSEPASKDDREGGGCAIFLVVTAALTVLVLVIAGLVAWAVSSSPTPVEVRTRDRYAVGTCILATPASSGIQGDVDVAEVPCDGVGPKSGRVTAKVKIPLPCPNGTAAIVLAGEELSLCVTK